MSKINKKEKQAAKKITITHVDCYSISSYFKRMRKKHTSKLRTLT